MVRRKPKRIPARRSAQRSHRQAADLLRRGDVSVHKSWRQIAHRHVVKPIAGSVARQKRRACKDAVVPRGTPVSAPVEMRDSMQAVLILDALWQWAPPADECEAIFSRAVWLPTSSISSHYPN